MPYAGTCIDGPMDGVTLVVRRINFIAVHKPVLKYWVYRGDDAANTFTLDLTVTPEEEAAGLNGPDWDGSRTWNLQVQKELWNQGFEVVAVPQPWFGGRPGQHEAGHASPED